MPATYIPIASTTLSSNSASVTFSSIPGTYTDLVIRITGRLNTSESPPFQIRFNGSTASNYSTTTIRSTYNGTVSSLSSTNSTLGVGLTYAPGPSGTANTFSSTEYYIANYTISANKAVSAFGASEQNTTTSSEMVLSANAGLWRVTDAITSITILNTNPYDWVSGSSFHLYGIKKD